jgi:serpin B
MTMLDKQLKRFAGCATVLVLIGLAVGCAGKSDVVQSDKSRLASDASGAEMVELVASNGAFAFDLYQALRRAEPGNLFYSPYSISLALAMTYAGARGETEQQMADTLHFTLSQERLHPAWNALDAELARRGQGEKAREGQGFALHIANSLWGQQGYAFLAEFLDLLAEHYGAGLRTLDFAGAPEAARVAINDWVSKQTEERIQNLIPPGIINPLTRLVLANAIYFNASWKHPFQESMTSDGPFHLLDGSQVAVPMMRQAQDFGYVEGEGVQAVELPYLGDEMSMVLLMPEAGGFEAFEGALDAGRVDALLENLSRRRVALTMPRFEFESSLALRETLDKMGMPDAFGEGVADFSGMDGTRNLYISAVVHKAFVAVDEAGTEAAAATAVVIGERAAPAEPVEMTVDRPFVFVIRDRQTGTILFVGRVVDPSTA